MASGTKGFMSIGIIDVGIGNIGSLRGALYSQGWDAHTVASPADISGVTHLLLPGVGSYSSAMKRLVSTGLVDLIRVHAAANRPLMGICLGMQLLADIGLEGQRSAGLGLVPGEVVPFERNRDLRLPHVGWNVMRRQQSHPLLKGIKLDVDFYFVHSYYFDVSSEEDVVGTTEYGLIYPSFIARGSVVGTQFHPEKSQRNGLRLLDNFCLWDGLC
jgi:imidazole glycerol-phosphate synthase subunit HisH